MQSEVRSNYELQRLSENNMVRLLATWLVRQDNIQVCATATVRTPITCDAVTQPLLRVQKTKSN